jgi:hypothetical protein
MRMRSFCAYALSRTLISRFKKPDSRHVSTYLPELVAATEEDFLAARGYTNLKARQHSREFRVWQ